MADLGSILKGPIGSLINNPLFGADVTYRRVVDGVYDPVTGTTPQTITDSSIKGVVDAYTIEEQDTENVQAGDRRVIISSNDISFEPTKNDRVVIDSNEYGIEGIKIDQGGNTAVIYTLQVRL